MGQMLGLFLIILLPIISVAIVKFVLIQARLKEQAILRCVFTTSDIVEHNDSFSRQEQQRVRNTEGEKQKTNSDKNMGDDIIQELKRITGES